MFTSKKALYLANDFTKISPITNIDSLYFELVQKDENSSSYLVFRHSVAKSMPIAYEKVISDDAYRNNTSTSLDCHTIGMSDWEIDYAHNLHFINIKNTPITVDISTYYLENNPYDWAEMRYLYETSLFTIETGEYIQLDKILNHYETLYRFDTSFDNIYAFNEKLNTSLSWLDDQKYIIWNSLYTNTELQTYTNNDIYGIEYNKNSKYSSYIKVLNVSTFNVKDTVSLNTFFSDLNMYNLMKKWIFDYDVNNQNITYLKDEFNNEGWYDFRSFPVFMSTDGEDLLYNARQPNSNNIRNNKLFVEPNLILFKTVSNSNLLLNNTFINSYCVDISTSSQKCEISNNFVINSSNILFGNTNFRYLSTIMNNNIVNSSNYKVHIINGINNTITNCTNCSIFIEGNNNYIANLNNVTLYLRNNNIAISDNIDAEYGSTKVWIENDRLYSSGSISKAILYSTYANDTLIFGDNSSVFFEGIGTI